MINRRTFIKKSSLIASTSLLNIDWIEKKSLKLGLQLYTLNTQMKQSVLETLRKVASFGYQEVETYSYNFGANKYYWGYKPQELKTILDDLHLTTSSGHYDLNKFFSSADDDLLRYVDDCIQGASVLKQDFIVWPWLAPEFRSIEQFKVLADKLNKIGERVKKAKLQLAYHNHDFEFIDHNGQIGYDVILKNTDPKLVKMEMDLYWFSHSSQKKALDYFTQYPKRFPIWHIKDMDKKDRELHAVVGDGTIDFNTFLKDAKLAELKHIFVEQGNNYVPDAFTCVEKSAKYVKKNFLK